MTQQSPVRHWYPGFRFTTPPARAWVRQRHLPVINRRGGVQPTSPEWDGAWHLTTGDFRWYGRTDYPYLSRFHVSVACGRRETGESFRVDGQMVRDLAITDERPEVDVCRRCLKGHERPVDSLSVYLERLAG